MRMYTPKTRQADKLCGAGISSTGHGRPCALPRCGLHGTLYTGSADGDFRSSHRRDHETSRCVTALGKFPRYKARYGGGCHTSFRMSPDLDADVAKFDNLQGLCRAFSHTRAIGRSQIFRDSDHDLAVGASTRGPRLRLGPHGLRQALLHQATGRMPQLPRL